MVIVSGWLRVRPDDRDAYLAGCRAVIAAARRAAGNVGFYMSADPIEPDRINVFEQWESASAIEAFRGSGPSDGQVAAIVAASVHQHEIASTVSLS